MRKQHQVLLLCQLLRSVCCASTQAGVSLRLARRADIDAIAAINQRTLPENYTRQFYIQHLMRWPQLNFVAEADAETIRALKSGVLPAHIELELPQDMDTSSMRSRGVGLGLKLTSAARAGAGGKVSEDDAGEKAEAPREVIGYVLGRMEDSIIAGEQSRQGHITSLAVMSDYRRLGVAHALMLCLHENMCRGHAAEQVGLHVRVSNKAATRLYKDVLGYKVARTVAHYYHDGEDAYVMTRPLPVDAAAAAMAAGPKLRGAGSSLFSALEQAGGA